MKLKLNFQAANYLTNTFSNNFDVYKFNLEGMMDFLLILTFTEDRNP